MQERDVQWYPTLIPLLSHTESQNLYYYLTLHSINECFIPSFPLFLTFTLSYSLSPSPKSIQGEG